jgi:hypothetical protein
MRLKGVIPRKRVAVLSIPTEVQQPSAKRRDPQKSTMRRVV